jgi:hypothetical protein
MGISGVLSIVFGVLVLAQPVAGAFALVYLFGFYAVLTGIVQLALGSRLRGIGGRQDGRPDCGPDLSLTLSLVIPHSATSSTSCLRHFAHEAVTERQPIGRRVRGRPDRAGPIAWPRIDNRGLRR